MGTGQQFAKYGYVDVSLWRDHKCGRKDSYHHQRYQPRRAIRIRTGRFGLVFAYAMADQEEYMQALGAVLLAVIGFPLVFLQIGYYSKNLLRKKFARALDLEPAAN